LLNSTSLQQSGDCVICLDALHTEPNGTTLMRLPCMHLFHEECLTRWFGRSSKCPMCQVVVQLDDQ
jgi:hypothetical protein